MQKKAKKQIQTNQRQFDFILCIIIFLLLSLGIVMVLSASAPSSLSTYGNSYYYVSRQVIFAILGIAVMFFVSKIDYHVYKKFYKTAYWVSIIVLAAVIVPGLGSGAKGATRWIDLKVLTFQPSEIAKILLIIFYAGYLTEHKKDITTLKGCFIAYLYLAPQILILYFLQDHLSAAIIILAITSIMMLMSGIRLSHFLSLASVGGTVAAMRNVSTCNKIWKR